MSPRGLRKLLKRVPPGLRTDPLGDIVEREGHPSPTEIREYRGESTVKPLILSDALHILSPKRRTGGPELLHLVNTEGRPSFWNLGYSNLPEEATAIYIHDWGERYTLGGNYTVLRLITDPEVFGQSYDGTANAITNFRGTLTNQLEEKLNERRMSLKSSDVLEELRTLRRNVGSPLHQANEYRDLTENLDAYEDGLRSFGWSAADEQIAIGLLRIFRSRLDEAQRNLIPGEVIIERTEPYFDDIAVHAQGLDAVTLDPNCKLGPKENPLMHMLGHLQYSGHADNNFEAAGRRGSYLESLLAYSIKQTASGDPLAHVAMMAKIQESADNIRKESVMTLDRSHMAYHKAMAVSNVGKRYIEFLTAAKDSRAQRMDFALIFLKSELLKRVIGDYNYFSTRPDTDQRKQAPWVAEQFKIIRDSVGYEVEHYMVSQLQSLRRSNLSERESADSILSGYSRLSKMHPAPHGMRPRSFRILGMF